MSAGFTTVRIDGELVDTATASIPVTDLGFIRGIGAFEVMRGFSGVCFRLQPHIERLERSSDMVGITLPDHDLLASWCRDAAEAHEESVVRILVSVGDDLSGETPRIVVTSEERVAVPGPLSLMPVFAPWHSDGAEWELLRGKTLSYGNNFAAIRQAKLAGFDDAFLFGRSGRILEGPTFVVGWTVEEAGAVIYETPSLSLGILDSITRELALDAAADAGLTVREVEVPLERLDDATEVFALSTMRDTLAVTQVGDRTFPEGPNTEALRNAMLERMAMELGQ